MKVSIKFPELKSWQPELFKITPEDKIVVVKSKRQVGKTMSANLLMIKYSIEKTGSESIFISPTLTQSRKVFQTTLKMLDGIPVIKNANGSTLEIFFENGSVIRYKSSEQQESALRGFTVSGVLIIDEAAYIKDDVFPVVLPYVNVHKAPVVLISTPMFKSGFFYEMFTSGDKYIKRIDVNDYDTSFFITPEQVELFRKTMPPQLFRSEVLGEFMEEKSGVFGDFLGVLNDTPKFNGEYYIGVDWGTGNGGDDTAIVVFNSLGEMVYVSAFNDLDAQETIEEVVKIVNKFPPKKITVEKNSIGNVFYDLLRKRLRYPITLFNTTNDTKNKIINTLQVGIQNKDISLLPDPTLKKELVAFQIESTRSGKITFNARSGEHDDLIMATAIAYYSVKGGSGKYVII